MGWKETMTFALVRARVAKVLAINKDAGNSKLGVSFFKQFMSLESAIQRQLNAFFVGLFIAGLYVLKLKLFFGSIVLSIIKNWLQVSYIFLLNSSIFINL